MKAAVLRQHENVVFNLREKINNCGLEFSFGPAPIGSFIATVATTTPHGFLTGTASALVNLSPFGTISEQSGFGSFVFNIMVTWTGLWAHWAMDDQTTPDGRRSRSLGSASGTSRHSHSPQELGETEAARGAL